MLMPLLVLAGAVLVAPAATGAAPVPRTAPPGIMRQAPQACVPVEAECVRVECEEECWEVRAAYESVEDGVQQATTGGLWGSISGARCHAEKVAALGFWLGPEVALQPTKVPAGALRLVVIDRAIPRP